MFFQLLQELALQRKNRWLIEFTVELTIIRLSGGIEWENKKADRVKTLSAFQLCLSGP